MPLAPLRAAIAACVCLVLTATAAHARTHVNTNMETASFYSHDRMTASGERFDKTALKGAHRSLPFGSIVKVVNRRNGKWVVIEINDRGPAKWTGRTIDLTREAAQRIGMIRQGVVPVRLEVAHVTRRQLNRAFTKLAKLLDLKAALEARALQDEASAATAPAPLSVAPPPLPLAPAPIQLASAVAGEVTHPIQALGNIFGAYMESLVVAAGPHVRLYCADGQPLPETLRIVLNRAAVEFERPVEVISGYRSLAYNRAIYGNRHKRRSREYVGDGSQHIRCRAADIRVAGISTAALHAWALRQPELGGVGRYRSDFIHVDIRPRDEGRLVTWDWRAKQKHARRHQPHHKVARRSQQHHKVARRNQQQHHRRYARA